MSTSSATGDREEEWTEGTCARVAAKDNFPANVKDINIQKSIITRFINFYTGGRNQKGLNVTDIIFAVISIMPKHEQTEEFIWNRTHYSENGTLFFLTPEDRLKAEAKSSNLNQQDGSEAKENQSEIPNSSPTEKVEQHYSNNEKPSKDILAQGLPETQVEWQENPGLHKVFKKDNFTDTEEYELSSMNKTNKDNFQNRTQNTSRENTTTGTCEKNNSEFLKVPKFPPNFQWSANEKDASDSDPYRPQYGPLENHAFNVSCNKLLSEWSFNQTGRIILKYFFGIIGLILMRCTTKKYTHLVNTFGSTKILSIMTFAAEHLKYSIPHKRCIKNSCRVLRKRDGGIPIMFAKIVSNSMEVDIIREHTRKGFLPRKNIYRFTVLSHTADYGFGLVSMLQNLGSLLGTPKMNKVVEATYCELTAKSWDILWNFVTKYMDGSRKATYHWARVIGSEYFRNVSCGDNFALAVILALFIEKCTNKTDIWKSAWVSSGSTDDVEDLKRLGENMFTYGFE